MERCRWEWLSGIENRDKVFPIHRSYKFNPVIVEKGGATEAIRTAFMRRNLDDWERADEFVTLYTRQQVERFSPQSRGILEIQSQRDLEILEKICANAVLLRDDGPDGWGIPYTTEFHMTNNSQLFPPRPRWEAKGYRPDEYSRWLLGDWRPIEEFWEALGVGPATPEPGEIDLEDWLFDTTASPERREAEARFVHGHLLKPGDVARTDWCLRCPQPPYDQLPIPRANIPPGVILSRDGESWVREKGCRIVRDYRANFLESADTLSAPTPPTAADSEIRDGGIDDVELPVYFGKVIYVGNWAGVPDPTRPTRYAQPRRSRFRIPAQHRRPSSRPPTPQGDYERGFVRRAERRPGSVSPQHHMPCRSEAKPR